MPYSRRPCGTPPTNVVVFGYLRLGAGSEVMPLRAAVEIFQQRERALPPLEARRESLVQEPAIYHEQLDPHDDRFSDADLAWARDVALRESVRGTYRASFQHVRATGLRPGKLRGGLPSIPTWQTAAPCRGARIAQNRTYFRQCSFSIWSVCVLSAAQSRRRPHQALGMKTPTDAFELAV
jgi:hypothetical protein